MYWRKRYVTERQNSTKSEVQWLEPQLDKLDRPIKLKEEELAARFQGQEVRMKFDPQLIFIKETTDRNAYNRFQRDLLLDGGSTALTAEAMRAAIDAQKQIWQATDAKIDSIRLLSTPNRAAYLANANRATSVVENTPLMIDTVTTQYLLDTDKIYYEYFIESKNAP